MTLCLSETDEEDEELDVRDIVSEESKVFSDAGGYCGRKRRRSIQRPNTVDCPRTSLDHSPQSPDKKRRRRALPSMTLPVLTAAANGGRANTGRVGAGATSSGPRRSPRQLFSVPGDE
jgi:hypothetical protein